MNINPLWCGPLLVLLGLLVDTGCVVQLESHCANLEGDPTCTERGDGTFCNACQAENDGCTDVMPSQQCYFAGPGEESPSSTSDETPGDDTTDTTKGTDTPESTTTEQPLCTNDECGGATPFCELESGECVSCEGTAEPDAACVELSEGMLPVCSVGVCVECTAGASEACAGETPVCDDATRTCVPCREHAECESGACELAVGRCFPPDVVVHVDGDGGQDYTTISAALSGISGEGIGIIVVHDLGGGSSYQGTAPIDAGKTIALLAAPGESPSLLGTGGNPGLRVEGVTTTAYIDGLRIAGNTNGLGVRVDGAVAWLDRSRIVQNSGGGILAQNGAELTLRNCFVGGPAQDVDAVVIADSTLDMLYTTVGGGGVISTQARALFCSNATATVRNSILVSLDTMPEVVCPGVRLATSAIEADVGFMASWFAGYGSGDFSLTASGATVFADIAEWSPGDPPTDIDSDPRPTNDGSLDYPGADVP